MKTKKICAVLLSGVVMASAFGAGCKKSSDDSTSSVSDTGISLSIDPNVTGTTTADPSATTTSGASGDTTAATESSYYIKMTYEENYDAAAIAEMGKKCTVHGVSFKEFDFNFYYANEYVSVMSSVMANADMMTQAGFVNLDYKISDTMTIRDYLRQTVETDLQGEAFLADYATKNNIKLPQATIDDIESQITHAQESAQVYNMTLDEYLKSLYGPTANTDVLRAALQRYELANLAQKTFVEEYKFAEGEDQLPIVYHVLYMTMDKNSGADLPEDQQAAAKKKADDLLAAISTLDDLKTKGQAALDAGEAQEASQYTVELGQMVPEFEEWCFADHKEGDKAIVKTQFGYHVMYFVGTQAADEKQKQNIALYKMQDDLTAAINSGEYDVKYE